MANLEGDLVIALEGLRTATVDTIDHVTTYEGGTPAYRLYKADAYIPASSFLNVSELSRALADVSTELVAQAVALRELLAKMASMEEAVTAFGQPKRSRSKPSATS